MDLSVTLGTGRGAELAALLPFELEAASEANTGLKLETDVVRVSVHARNTVFLIYSTQKIGTTRKCRMPSLEKTSRQSLRNADPKTVPLRFDGTHTCALAKGKG